MRHRLPQLPVSTDSGHVYVLERNGAYKVGFSRNQVQRRARDHHASLVLTITAGQHPSSLERAIHRRFSDKRLPLGREWFALTAADLDWLRGLATMTTDSD